MTLNQLPSYLALTIVLVYSTSSAAELACMKTVQNEEQINICQHSEATRLLLELNDLESAIHSRFQSPQAERFDEAQARWREMAAKDCEIEADFYEGASIYLAIHSECLQRHYLDRMATLKKYVCPEHSLGNGCELVTNETVPAAATPTPVELPPAELPLAESQNQAMTKPKQIKSTKRKR